MSEEKVDLSALDPSRDEERWEGLIQSVAARALAARRRRLTVASQLRAWTRPALAIAALVPLAVWLGSLIHPPRTQSAVAGTDPAYALARWAAQNELPTTTEMFQALGGSHDRN